MNFGVKREVIKEVGVGNKKQQLKTIIIAEAGVNHNGSVDTAMKMIDAAVEAGADYVKFQTFKAKKLVNQNAEKADYQKNNLKDADESQYKMLKKLELDLDTHRKLIQYCNKKKIGFLSSAFDPDSIELLHTLKLDYWKIPSGEITNFPYLKKIGQYNEKIILSTGMSNMDDIADALDALTNSGTDKNKIFVLHCNTEYPTPMIDVNLNAMRTIREKLNVKVGYSDHTLGIEVPVAAVALGAMVIEKHFTLSRTTEGPDHKASLEPEELIQMVRAIRNIELALGNGIKKPSKSESKNINIVRKSIYALTDIQKGEKFSEENLITKRPAGGLSAMMWEEVIGKKAKKDFKPDDLIEL